MNDSQTITTDIYDSFSCRLCIEFNDFNNSRFAQSYPNLLTKNSFFQTKHYQVMIPLGPLCEGHLLIASKKHAWSFGHLGNANITELSKLISNLKHFLEKTYKFNKFIVFEHGAMSLSQPGSCCLEHAHLNLIPIDKNESVLKIVSEVIDFKRFKLEKLNHFVKQNKPYLFFSCDIEGSYAAAAPENASQFFRKILAPKMNIIDWDWKDNLRVESAKNMRDILIKVTN